MVPFLVVVDHLMSFVKCVCVCVCVCVRVCACTVAEEVFFFPVLGYCIFCLCLQVQCHIFNLRLCQSSLLRVVWCGIFEYNCCMRVTLLIFCMYHTCLFFLLNVMILLLIMYSTSSSELFVWIMEYYVSHIYRPI